MQQFVADPSVEFDYYLAERLSRTVAEVREMSNREYVGWQMYYQRKAQRVELERLKAEAQTARGSR